MNAREWDLIMLEVDTEWEELMKVFNEEWIGERARMMEQTYGTKEQVHGQEGAELV